MSEAEPMEGVRHEQIVINAATPDVLAAVCKKITDSVMELIPEDSISKIAQSVIDSGVAIKIENNRSYSRETLSNIANKAVAARLSEAVKKHVDQLWILPATQAFLAESCADAFADAIAQVPAILAQQVAQRLTCQYLPDMQVQLSESTVERKVEQLKQDLRDQTNICVTDIY